MLRNDGSVADLARGSGRHVFLCFKRRLRRLASHISNIKNENTDAGIKKVVEESTENPASPEDKLPITSVCVFFADASEEPPLGFQVVPFVGGSSSSFSLSSSSGAGSSSSRSLLSHSSFNESKREVKLCVRRF